MKAGSRLLATVAGALILTTQHSLWLGAEEKQQKSKPPQVKVITGPEKTRTLKIRKPADFIELEAHAIRVKIQFPDGKAGEDIILLLYEPLAGTFWWEYQYLDPKQTNYSEDKLSELLQEYEMFAITGKIVSFRLQGSRIYVRESNEQQPTFSEAVGRVIATMEKNLSDVFGDPIKGRLTIHLSEPLGRDFFRGSKLVAQWRPSKLVGVSRTDADWTLTLEGPDGESATVVLSSDYKVEKAAREGRTVFPKSEQKNEKNP